MEDEISNDFWLNGDLPVIDEKTKLKDLKDDIYSTNEIKTNKVWIDGKPIYRKVQQLTITTNQQYHNHNIVNLDKVINVYGFCQAKSNSYKMTIPMTYVNWVIDVYDFTNTQFKTNVSQNQLNRGFEYVYIIIEYTKTI